MVPVNLLHQLDKPTEGKTMLEQKQGFEKLCQDQIFSSP